MKRINEEYADPAIAIEEQSYRLAQESFEGLWGCAAETIGCEKVRREHHNRSEILALRGRYTSLLDRRKELKEQLRHAPEGDLANAGRERWFYAGIALVLIVAGVALAEFTVVPFGMGREAWALCVGLGLVTPFLVDVNLEQFSSRTVIRIVSLVALMSGLAGLIVLAFLRGDILAFYLHTSVSADPSNTLQYASAATHFYTHAIPLLRVSLAALAVAMELGSGMAIFEFRKRDPLPQQQVADLRKELEEVENELADIIARVTQLEEDPVVIEALFWRNFNLGFLESIKRHTTLLPVMLLCGIFFGFAALPNAHAQILPQNPSQTYASSHRRREVIELDRTLSVAAQGYDGESEYEKDANGVCATIERAAPGSQITVLGITDQSFSRPDMLLNAAVPRSAGPLLFQNRIVLAKANLVRQFKRASSGKPRFPQTDIFGALVLAADMLREGSGAPKTLIVFSDMRNSADGIDLERPSTVPIQEALRQAERQDLVAPLSGVDVYVLGVDGEGKSVAYWQSLKHFWEAYFRKTGAVLREYSALRDFPDGTAVH